MRVGVWWLLLGFVACDSNPTPHPGADATYDTGVDTAQPSENKGPDDDGDGVPDCDEAGGFWDGDSCRDDVAGAVDAGETAGEGQPDGGDVDAPDASDGDDAEDGAGGDGDPADGSASEDAGQSDSGPD